MTPFEIIAEWRKGCSKTCHNKTPADCVECTNEMVNALEKLLRGLEEPMHLLMRLNAWKNHLQGLCQGPSDTWATPEKCAEQLRVRLHSKVRVREEFRSFLEELIDLCAVGNVSENSEHLGWAAIVRTAKQFLGQTAVNDDCKNTLYIFGYDGEGKRTISHSRSCHDLNRDNRIIGSALELAQAVLLRGVDITPEQLYRHVVGRNYVAKPIDMVLHCPACGEQHIDAPHLAGDAHAPEAPPKDASHEEAQPFIDALADYEAAWTNPPHRSHLCAGCGYIWRPADVETNGVAETKTRGKDDSPVAQVIALAQAYAVMKEKTND